MTLEEAVICGRFCGLETVEECILSYYDNMFSYKEFPAMWEKLVEEYLLWKEDNSLLDFDKIDAQVAADLVEYEASERKREDESIHKTEYVDFEL